MLSHLCCLGLQDVSTGMDTVSEEDAGPLQPIGEQPTPMLHCNMPHLLRGGRRRGRGRGRGGEGEERR